MPSPPASVGGYLIRETIGAGSHCTVKLAERLVTGELFAVKITEKSEFQPNLAHEVTLMRTLKHPHILKLVDAFEDDSNHYLLTEYGVHGELFEHLRARKSLPADRAMHFFRQLIYGLEYLHQRSICHRDLKPENLFLDAHDDLLIGDFGLARSTAEGPFRTTCGSIPYIAPEAFSGQPYDGKKADIWSCGIILFAMIAGRLPFVDPCESALIGKIRAGRLNIQSFPAQVRDLIVRILTVNTNARFSIEQIKGHPAFRLGLPKDYELPKPILGKVGSEIGEFLGDSGEGEREKVMGEVGHQAEFVLKTVQRYAGGAGLDWVHPDDKEMICKRKSDGLEIVVGVRHGKSGVDVSVKMVQGKEMAFKTVAGNMLRAVERMGPDQL